MVNEMVPKVMASFCTKGKCKQAISCALSAVIVMSLSGAAQAALTLTAAGVAQGLSLSTFATGFPNGGGVGPLGIVFPTSGGVLVSDTFGNVRLFPSNADGQNAASAPVGQIYGGDGASGMALIGSKIYASQGVNGRVVQLNPTGTFNQTIVSGLDRPVGLVANPVNGQLYTLTAAFNQVFDIDPIAKTATLFATVPVPDGLFVTPDGKTLYVAATGLTHVLGFDIQSKTQVFDSGMVLPGSIDGIAIGTVQSVPMHFVNMNFGSLAEVNLTTLAQTIIATGGSRGDFVTIDPATNTLLVTQTDSILRLHGPIFVPEPSSYLLLGIGLVCLLAFSRGRRQFGNVLTKCCCRNHG
jgi:DNA-binding beta-propeller fold protein YncE